MNEIVVVLAGLEYPPSLLAANDDDVVIDVGANIGGFALYFDSLHPGIRYHGIAIEPFGDNFALLKTNLLANGIDRFTAYEAAISDTDGKVRIRTDLPVDEVQIADQGTGLDVTSFKLSTFCAQLAVDRIDLLKMDVEGAEHDILRADYEFFCSHVAKTILECHELPGRTIAALVDRLDTAFEVEIVHRTPTSSVVYAENRRIRRGLADSTAAQPGRGIEADRDLGRTGVDGPTVVLNSLTAMPPLRPPQ